MSVRLRLGVCAFALLPVPFVPAGNAFAGEPGYASEVPQDIVVVDKKGSALAADDAAGTIPVAEEIDFVRENSFHQSSDQKLKAIARVDYFGTRYVGCE